MTQAQKTAEQLRTEKRELLNRLNNENREEVLAMIRENERQTKQAEKMSLLKRVNEKYARLRELAKIAYECEQPTEDITCADGSFHKTKVKKYPKIAAAPYCSAVWKDDRIVTLRINGEKFQMYREKYEYSKPTEYTRPETFADFLKLNSIMPEDMTAEQYDEICGKLAALNAQLKKDVEAYNNGLAALSYASLNYWGLIGQHNVNLYEYTPNA